MATAQATRNAVTLQGSAAIISEYMDYAINSILFQRGIYPAKTFAHHEKYGMNLLMSADPYVQDKLKYKLKTIEGFMAKNWVRTVSLDLINFYSNELIESWDFEVKTENNGNLCPKTRTSHKRIQQEIASVMRQILSTVSCLPKLHGYYLFDLSVVFADGCTPRGWGPTTYLPIKNAEKLVLQPFSTGLHQVKTAVNYKPFA